MSRATPRVHQCRREQCSTYGVGPEDVVIAGRRKVAIDLDRRAERHIGARVDVEAAAHALAAGAGAAAAGGAT